MIVPFIILILGLYLGLILILYLFQARLIYFPIKALAATPADIGLAYEDVRLETEDGVKLAGWFVPAEGAEATLLFFHGNAGNISHRLESIERFHRLGLNVFIIDYRGYGQSEGSPSEQGTYRDAAAAWRYLVEEQHIAPDNIVIFGRSLGGAVGAWLATQHRPGALILESTFASVPEMAARHYPFLPVRWLARFRYDTLARMSSITSPILIIHSPDDEIIPFQNGERLFAAASAPKQFLQIKGGHNEGFILSRVEYEAGLQDFLERHLASR